MDVKILSFSVFSNKSPEGEYEFADAMEVGTCQTPVLGYLKRCNIAISLLLPIILGG